MIWVGKLIVDHKLDGELALDLIFFSSALARLRAERRYRVSAGETRHSGKICAQFSRFTGDAE